MWKVLKCAGRILDLAGAVGVERVLLRYHIHFVYPVVGFIASSEIVLCEAPATPEHTYALCRALYTLMGSNRSDSDYWPRHASRADILSGRRYKLPAGIERIGLTTRPQFLNNDRGLLAFYESHLFLDFVRT